MPSTRGWQGVVEEDEQNNIGSGDADVINAPADLRVVSVVASEGARSGEEVTLTWEVENVGGDVWEGTQYWRDGVWLSRDPVLDRNRATLLTNTIYNPDTPLLSGQSYTNSATVKLPAGTDGVYYLHVATDVGAFIALPNSELLNGSAGTAITKYQTQVFEDENDPTGNYGRGLIDITFAEPDLQVTSIDVPANAASGSQIDVTYTVSNTGSRATRENIWYDRVFISVDGSLDRQDHMIGEFRRVGALGIGESYQETLKVDLPVGIEGDFTIFVETDSTSDEGFSYQVSTVLPGLQGLRSTYDEVPEFIGEGNNRASALVSVSKAVTADLVIADISIPQRAITGQPLTVSYTIANTGGRSTEGGWRDLIYLSRDETLDPRRDFYLGFHDHDAALEAGDDITVSLATRLPKGITGSYFIYVISDQPSANLLYGKVFEDGAEDNVSVSAQPLIIDPAPPADLVASSIAVSGGTSPGDLITVDWIVTNDALEVAQGSWSDAVYLSKDGEWDIGDLFLGRFSHTGGLAAGATYQGTVTAALPSLKDGAWRVIVRTDARNEVEEGAAEINNTSLGQNAVTVSSPLVTLGIPQDITLAPGVEKLFRIEVPADQTMRVTLSGGNLDFQNELFLKWDDVPTGSDFDAGYDNPLAANQTALISSTEPGVYYILVRSLGENSASGEETFTLLAEILPFQITNVSPDQGGSARFVTMSIEGAGIQEGAIAKLSRPGVAEFLPVSVKRIDATRMIAIFDLEGAPHGLYDVVVTNADGEVAIEPYRYLIERAVERDVTVGLGGPRIVPAGQAGFYSVVVDSLTNVDTPYVRFTFGAPEMGTNDMAYGLPFLDFNTNLGGGSDEATDILGLTGSQAPINRNGQWLAPGYAFDLAARGQASMSFSVQTYPGLQALIDRDFDKFKAFLYDRDPALAEADALAGGIDALKDIDPLFHDIFTDPGYEVVYGDLPWYLPFQFNVVAAATPMTREEFVAEQITEAERLRQAVLADAEANPALQTLAADGQAWVDGFLFALEQVGMLRDEADAPPVYEQARITSLVASLSQGILYGPSGDEILSNGNLADFYAQVRTWYGSTPAQEAPVARMDLRNPPQGIPYSIPVPELPQFGDYDRGLSRETTFTAFNIFAPWLGSGAVDLPDFGSDATTGELIELDLERFREAAGAEGAASLTGPLGYGEENWVPDDVALPHAIGFSAEEGSARPVREVRIVTTLDDALDPRSFRLGGITLGSLSVDVPAGRAVYQTDIDLSGSRGFVLRVSAGIDIASQTATWLLQAIDPQTGEVLEGDGFEGLLLAGETGAVRYTAQAKEDAENGAEVIAQARCCSIMPRLRIRWSSPTV
jgi:hypothetical protein